VLEYYQSARIVTVDGTAPPEDVTKTIEEAIAPRFARPGSSSTIRPPGSNRTAMVTNARYRGARLLRGLVRSSGMPPVESRLPSTKDRRTGRSRQSAEIAPHTQTCKMRKLGIEKCSPGRCAPFSHLMMTSAMPRRPSETTPSAAITQFTYASITGPGRGQAKSWGPVLPLEPTFLHVEACAVLRGSQLELAQLMTRRPAGGATPCHRRDCRLCRRIGG